MALSVYVLFTHHDHLITHISINSLGNDFQECCPSKEGHGVCTLLWCVDLDQVSIRNNCNCVELEDACSEVSIFAAMVNGLDDMCTAVGYCCEDVDVVNSEWDTCMDTKIAAGEFVVPDFDTIIPGGVPDLNNIETATTTEATTTEAVTTTTTTQVVTTQVTTNPITTAPITTTEAVTTQAVTTEAITTDVATTDSTNVPATLPILLPPPSLACIAGGQDFSTCCPTADPNDGICTLLLCYDLETTTIDEGCGCGQIVTACSQVSMFGMIVEGLSDICGAVEGCCEDDMMTSNDDFDTCLTAAITDGNIVVPDLDALMGGGGLMPSGSGGNTGTDSTEPSTATDPTEPADDTPSLGFSDKEEVDDSGSGAGSIYYATGLFSSFLLTIMFA